MSLNKTDIEWARNPDGSPGYTWNPITGCLNGCEYCYARKLANTRLRERYLANDNLAGGFPLARGALNENAIPPKLDPFYPRFWEDRLGEPIEKATPKRPLKPKGIFVCDMSDLFGIGIPESWTEQVMTTIKLTPWNRYYLLTKQPQNLIKFKFTDNAWVGVTATNDQMMLEAIKNLKGIQAKVKYLSIEPFLGRIDTYWLDVYLKDAGIKWVIIGAQTKPTIMPKIEWVKEIVEACDKAGISVFLKNNLRDLLVPTALMDDIFWESEKAKLRQEFPIED